MPTDRKNQTWGHVKYFCSVQQTQDSTTTLHFKVLYFSGIWPLQTILNVNHVIIWTAAKVILAMDYNLLLQVSVSFFFQLISLTHPLARTVSIKVGVQITKANINSLRTEKNGIWICKGLQNRVELNTKPNQGNLTRARFSGRDSHKK